MLIEMGGTLHMHDAASRQSIGRSFFVLVEGVEGWEGFFKSLGR